MAEIRVGTTSWTEKTLLASGRFYPPGVRTAEARLRHYASRFDLVEVDSLYYRLPEPRLAAAWTSRTPPGFRFDVKAFRLFTQHRTPASALPADLRAELPAQSGDFYFRDLPAEITAELWRRFRAGIAPLARAGKLGAVLFQFAPWFVFQPASFAHIERCAEALRGVPIAIELRNKSWFSERTLPRTLAFERKHHLTHVVVDEPQGFFNSVPPVWARTSKLAIVRLHGRNRRTWNARGLASAAERFNYRYSDDELAGFVDPVRELAAKSRRVHVLFNNCYRDYAQQNAATFGRMLTV